MSFLHEKGWTDNIILQGGGMEPRNKINNFKKRQGQISAKKIYFFVQECSTDFQKNIAINELICSFSKKEQILTNCIKGDISKEQNKYKHKVGIYVSQ